MNADVRLDPEGDDLPMGRIEETRALRVKAGHDSGSLMDLHGCTRGKTCK
jgi:hypothetical protein